MTTLEKLEILGAAARYDVSCSSSWVQRSGVGRLGSTLASGICHSWAADGRCISLLKILLTNHCVYDCLYCVNRRSNDQPRAHFTPHEVVDLTMGLYRRNAIEGLFLSSGVFRNPDATMERLVSVVKILRLEQGFAGYIHLKAIPGADPRLIRLAGLYADRMSVNIELPSRASLAVLAPDKSAEAIFQPMRQIALERADRPQRLLASSPPLTLPALRSRPAADFVPAGQSTQMIVGASPETDFDILRLSSQLYASYQLKRVYFSAYVPVNLDQRLPALGRPPLLREHRLYQSDWLMRFYGFSPEDLLDPTRPNLDTELDPKAAWACRHPEFFPLDINRAPLASLLRVPGLGPTSVQKVIQARRSARLRRADVAKLGAVWRRAEPFLWFADEARPEAQRPDQLRQRLLDPAFRGRRTEDPRQGWLLP